MSQNPDSQSSSGGPNPNHYPWLEGFQGQLRALSLNLDKQDYYRLVKKFESLVSVEATKLRHKPKRATKFVPTVKRLLANLKLIAVSTQWDQRREDRIYPWLGLILTHYINIVHASSLKNSRSSEAIASDLYVFVKQILEGSDDYVLDTILCSNVIQDTADRNTTGYFILLKIIQERRIYTSENEPFLKFLSILKLMQECEGTERLVNRTLFKIKAYPSGFRPFVQRKLDIKIPSDVELELSLVLRKIKTVKMIKLSKERLTYYTSRARVHGDASEVESDDSSVLTEQNVPEEFFLDTQGQQGQSWLLNDEDDLNPIEDMDILMSETDDEEKYVPPPSAPSTLHLSQVNGDHESESEAEEEEEDVDDPQYMEIEIKSERRDEDEESQSEAEEAEAEDEADYDDRDLDLIPSGLNGQNEEGEDHEEEEVEIEGEEEEEEDEECDHEHDHEPEHVSETESEDKSIEEIEIGMDISNALQNFVDPKKYRFRRDGAEADHSYLDSSSDDEDSDESDEIEDGGKSVSIVSSAQSKYTPPRPPLPPKGAPLSLSPVVTVEEPNAKKNEDSDSELEVEEIYSARQKTTDQMDSGSDERDEASSDSDADYFCSPGSTQSESEPDDDLLENKNKSLEIQTQNQNKSELLDTEKSPTVGTSNSTTTITENEDNDNDNDIDMDENGITATASTDTSADTIEIETQIVQIIDGSTSKTKKPDEDTTIEKKEEELGSTSVVSPRSLRTRANVESPKNVEKLSKDAAPAPTTTRGRGRTRSDSQQSSQSVESGDGDAAGTGIVRRLRSAASASASASSSVSGNSQSLSQSQSSDPDGDLDLDHENSQSGVKSKTVRGKRVGGGTMDPIQEDDVSSPKRVVLAPSRSTRSRAKTATNSPKASPSPARGRRQRRASSSESGTSAATSTTSTTTNTSTRGRGRRASESTAVTTTTTTKTTAGTTRGRGSGRSSRTYPTPVPDPPARSLRQRPSSQK